MAPPLVIPKHFKHKFFFSNRVPLLIHTSNELDVVIDPTQVKTNLVNSKKREKIKMSWIIISKIHGLLP